MSRELYMMNNYGERDLVLTEGQGMFVFDESGRVYLDFTAGIAVVGLGHCHPAITVALVKQASTLVHTSNLFIHPLRDEVAGKLADLSKMDKVFFCNSGTEANEAAIKLARKYAYQRGESNRTKIVSLPGGFHGRSLGALSITPRPAYQEGYAPLLPRCQSAEGLEQTLELIDEDTAAVFVEVIQGEGGVRVVPNQLLQQIEARTRQVGSLLVVDEVQTGLGRTGAVFAFEEAGIRPDIVTLAKGLGNGLPIGAVLATEEIAQAFTPGSHGSTFGGNLVALACAKVVLNEVSKPEFLHHVREMGDYLAQKLRSIGLVSHGVGLMRGVALDNPQGFVARAKEVGVLLTTAGAGCVRFVPPLIVERMHVDMAIERLSTILPL